MTVDDFLKWGTPPAIVAPALALWFYVTGRRAQAKLIVVDRQVVPTQVGNAPMLAIESGIENGSTDAVSDVQVTGNITVGDTRYASTDHRNIGQSSHRSLAAGQRTLWLNMEVPNPGGVPAEDVRVTIKYSFVDKNGKRRRKWRRWGCVVNRSSQSGRQSRF